MITPRPPSEYPWAPGAILVHALGLAPEPAAALQQGTLVAGLDALADPHLRRLCRSAIAEPPVAVPAPLGELAAWCAAHLATGEPRAIGLAVGAIAWVYGHRGWAVVAAAAAAGPAADQLPPFDDLVAAVGAELDRRLATAVEPLVAARIPTPDGLAEPPPGAALIAGALETLARGIAEVEHPVPITATGALERAFVAALAAEPRAPFAPRSSAPERAELATAVADRARAWTWADFETWRTGDPFLAARAIARAHGLGMWIAPFAEVGAEVAAVLDTELHGAWEVARAAAFAGLPAPAGDPLVVAIAELAQSAATAAARAIADRLATGPAPDAAFVAELLGDPRARPELWRDAAPAIRAAVGEGA